MRQSNASLPTPVSHTKPSWPGLRLLPHPGLPIRPLLWLLLLATLTQPHHATAATTPPPPQAAAAAAASGAVTVDAEASTESEFVAAMSNNSVTVLRLRDNLRLDALAWPATGGPIVRSSNLTVLGSPTAGSYYPILDLAFTESKMQLLPGVVFVFKQVELRNTRLQSGFEMDIFAASPGAAVRLDTMVFHCFSCLPLGRINNSLTSQDDVLGDLPTNVTGGKETWCRNQPALPRTCYDPAQVLHFWCASAVLPQTGLLNVALGGGYMLEGRDVVFVCESPVTEECGQLYGFDTCMRNKITELCAKDTTWQILAGNSTAQHTNQTAQQTTESSSAAAGDNAAGRAGAIAGGVVGGAVFIAAVITATAVYTVVRRREWRRRGRLHNDAERPSPKEAGPAGAAATACTAAPVPANSPGSSFGLLTRRRTCGDGGGGGGGLDCSSGGCCGITGTSSSGGGTRGGGTGTGDGPIPPGTPSLPAGVILPAQGASSPASADAATLGVSGSLGEPPAAAPGPTATPAQPQPQPHAHPPLHAPDHQRPPPVPAPPHRVLPALSSRVPASTGATAVTSDTLAAGSLMTLGEPLPPMSSVGSSWGAVGAAGFAGGGGHSGRGGGGGAGAAVLARWDAVETCAPVVVVAGITIELTSTIGTGSFGKVFRGTWQGRPVAVKILQYGSQLCRAVHNEVLLSQTLRHPNVVSSLFFAQLLPGGRLGLQISGGDTAAAAAAASADASAASVDGKGTGGVCGGAGPAAEPDDCRTSRHGLTTGSSRGSARCGSGGDVAAGTATRDGAEQAAGEGDAMMRPVLGGLGCLGGTESGGGGCGDSSSADRRPCPDGANRTSGHDHGECGSGGGGGRGCDDEAKGNGSGGDLDWVAVPPPPQPLLSNVQGCGAAAREPYPVGACGCADSGGPHAGSGGDEGAGGEQVGAPLAPTAVITGRCWRNAETDSRPRQLQAARDADAVRGRALSAPASGTQVLPQAGAGSGLRPDGASEGKKAASDGQCKDGGGSGGGGAAAGAGAGGGDDGGSAASSGLCSTGGSGVPDVLSRWAEQRRRQAQVEKAGGGLHQQQRRLLGSELVVTPNGYVLQAQPPVGVTPTRPAAGRPMTVAAAAEQMGPGMAQAAAPTASDKAMAIAGGGSGGSSSGCTGNAQTQHHTGGCDPTGATRTPSHIATTAGAQRDGKSAPSEPLPKPNPTTDTASPCANLASPAGRPSAAAAAAVALGPHPSPSPGPAVLSNNEGTPSGAAAGPAAISVAAAAVPAAPAPPAAATTALPLEALWLAAHLAPSPEGPADGDGDGDEDGGGGGGGGGSSTGFLVMELCEGGSAVTWRSARWNGPQELPDLSVILRIALDIAYGMSYIHSMGICHGDLKLSNILLARCCCEDNNPAAPTSLPASTSSASNGRPNDLLAGWVAKVCDFGLSRVLTGDRTHVSTRPYGTPTHMAPELWTKGHMSQPADVYAFGVTLWELATGERPYRGLNAAHILHRVLLAGERPALPPWLPPSYTRLVGGCWAQSPKDRPTFGEIVRHLEAMLAVLAAVAPRV